MDDEIEVDGLIEDDVEEEPTDEETSPSVDGETAPDEEREAEADNEPSAVIDTSTDMGDAGTSWTDIQTEDYDPLPAPSVETVTVSTDVIIDDYSAASLAAYQAAGMTPVAVLDDGTERVVTWADVFDPRPQPVSSTYVNEAAAVAAATNQHFWQRSTDPDSDGAGTGAFVTDDGQDDFLEAAAGGFADLGDGTGNTKPWHNLLMNSLGILLRTGLNNLVSITRSAIAFFDGEGNQSGNVVASFGKDGAQIGKDDESHLELDYHSLKLIDGDNPPNTYLHVSDLRGADGKATLTETFAASGVFYDLTYLASQIISVTVGGASASYTATTRLQVTRITLSESPQSGSTVSITYKTESDKAKSYTLGTRDLNAGVGGMSYAEGVGVKASGYASHAEGDRTEASGRVSHAEGVNTVASGEFSHAEGGSTHATGSRSHAEGASTEASGYNSHAEGDQTVASGGSSHAEGWSSEARGIESHAQNERTIALGHSQTVIGRFNSVDQNDRYALIIGNGGEWDDSFVDPENPNYDYDDEYTHSNALTVDWDGNVECNEVNGLALQSMGEMREASGTASVETETNRNVASIRLPPGTWLANARLQYPSNATGRRGAKLSMTSEDSGNPMSADVRTAVSGGTTQVQTERVFAITDSDVEGEADGKAPVYLIAWQNSGSTLLCAGSIQTVRLSPAIGESYDGGGGGSGGTTDYDDLTGKPAINGVTLAGDKSFAQLGMDFAGSPSSGGNAIRTNAILYGTVDGTSTSTAFTATVAGLTQLQDGTCVMLKNGVVTSAAGFTIDVNNLGAKPVYTNLAAATAESTKFNVNYTLLFVYDSTRVSGGCWVCYNGYDSNSNTIGYQLRTNSSTMETADKGYRYRLWFTSVDGHKWVPANTSTSTNATSARTPNSRPIDPFGPIIYYGVNGTTNANTTLNSAYIWQQYTLSLGYSFNATGAALTLTVNAPVYLKCAPQTAGGVVMEGFVQELPTTADGKVYIFLGTAYSATNIELRAEHPAYCFTGGALRKWTGQVVQAVLTAGDHITIENDTISVDELTAAQTAALLD